MSSKFRKLIEGQIIKIDNHHRGKENKYADSPGIHIHKSVKDKRGYIEIRIPLDEKQHIKYEKNENNLSLYKEVKQVLEKDKTLLRRFVNDVMSALESDWKATTEEIKKAIGILATYFAIEDEKVMCFMKTEKHRTKMYFWEHLDAKAPFECSASELTTNKATVSYLSEQCFSVFSISLTWKNKKCENIKIQQEGVFNYIGELNIKDNS